MLETGKTDVGEGKVFSKMLETGETDIVEGNVFLMSQTGSRYRCRRKNRLIKTRDGEEKQTFVVYKNLDTRVSRRRWRHKEMEMSRVGSSFTVRNAKVGFAFTVRFANTVCDA